MHKKLLMVFPFLLLSALAAKTQQTPHKAVLQSRHEIQYLLYLPAGYHQNPSQQYPLLLFLHGGGETGNDIEKVKTHGPPRLIHEGRDFPFIVVSPQNPEENGFWNETALIELLNQIQSDYRVDGNRVHLSGLSRGGYGAWRLAMSNPDRFASLITISGVSPAFYSRWLKDMPVWVFHGEDDPVIPVGESDEVVKQMQQRGQNVRYTRYKQTGHDAWTQAYDEEELFPWMLEQILKAKN
jgi:predicted peptidase